MKKRTAFILATLISLLIHAVSIWFFLVRWETVLMPASIETFLDDDGMRMVDLTEPANRIRPTKAKAVGVENNATTQETVARRQPEQRRPSSVVRRQQPQSNDPNNREESRRPITDDRRPPLAMRAPMPSRPRLPATALSENFGQGVGAQLPEDYFPDYQHGGHTYLNVMKRPGIDYFVQLKRAFKMAWDPIPVLRADMASNEVSRGAVKVVLGVAVDKAGNMNELFILKSSGLTRYDREAIRTIRASSPFTSPPPNLLTADGTLRMSWTFIVYM